MRKKILFLSALLCLLLLPACTKSNIAQIDKVYEKKYESAYHEIPWENYDLDSQLVNKLNDMELAYAFFNYPLLKDITLSSNSELVPPRINQLKLINKLQEKDDPLSILLNYYDKELRNLKETDKNYQKKSDAKLILDSIKNYEIFKSKAGKETKEKLETIISK